MHINAISLFFLTSTSLAVAAPSPNTAATSEKTILAALAGTYSLLNTSSTLNDVLIPDATYGANPVGLITYSASGYMSATITATEAEFRPNVTFPFQTTDSDADWAMVGKHSIGYAGPFRLNPAIPATVSSGQVFHGPLTVANVPTMVGAEHQRNYTIIARREGGKTVKYLKIGSERGGGYKGELWWKRLD